MKPHKVSKKTMSCSNLDSMARQEDPLYVSRVVHQNGRILLCSSYLCVDPVSFEMTLTIFSFIFQYPSFCGTGARSSLPPV